MTPPQHNGAGIVGFSLNPSLWNKYTAQLSGVDGGVMTPPYDMV